MPSSQLPETPQPESPYPTVRRKPKRWPWVLGAALVLAAVGAGIVYQRSPQRGVVAKSEIYRGVYYEAFAAGDGGLVHWVTVDTQAPGVSLFTTPLDAEAQKAGWQYKLQFTSDFVTRNKLAVGVNAAMFYFDSRYIQLPGDFAISTGTPVSDGVWAQTDVDSHLLWADGSGKLHCEYRKPPWGPEVRRDAKWAVSSQMVLINNGQINSYARTVPDNWTTLGISAGGRYLHMVVSTGLSERDIALQMEQRGIESAMSMDAGDSSAMSIGEGAKGVRPGRALWEWRAVATHLGIRADHLP